MGSRTLEAASTVYRKDVDRIDIARYYLKSELPNIITASSPEVSEALNESVDSLDEAQVWRLLEALSYTYRMNGVFHQITSQALDWHEVELPLEAITLSGTKPHINDIVFSDDIQKDPAKFAAFLTDYFAQHPEAPDDPAGLNEFRIRSDDIAHRTLMTIERKGKIHMLDGSHRLMAAAMLGATSVRAFAAVPNGKKPRTMKGDSTFLTLRKLYERYQQPEQREQILDVAAMLARTSTNGTGAVKAYWIEHPRSEKLKKAGTELIRRVRSPSKTANPETRTDK